MFPGSRLLKALRHSERPPVCGLAAMKINFKTTAKKTDKPASNKIPVDKLKNDWEDKIPWILLMFFARRFN